MTQELITVKALAIEVKTSSKNLRKWLRTNDIGKPGTRWEWPETHEVVKMVREHWNNEKKVTAPKVRTAAPVIEQPTAPLVTEKTFQEFLEKTKPVPQEPAAPTPDQITEDFAAEIQEEIIYQNTKSNWIIRRNTEGALRATYFGPRVTDSTPWITEETQIRKTLPKYIKEELIKALAER